MHFGRKGARRAALVLGLVAAGCGGAMGAAAPQLASAQQQSPRGCAGVRGPVRRLPRQGRRGRSARAARDGAEGLPLHGHDGDTGPFASAQDVFGYIKAKMPLPKSHAGTLSDAQYWAVTNYILAGKGVKLPAGGVTSANASSVVVNAH